MSSRTVLRAVSREVEVLVDVACDSCAAPLVSVFPDSFEEGALQVDGGLHVRLDGGYGEFVDLLSDADREELHFVLCTGCAQRMVDLLPFLRERVARHVSSHVGHVCSDGSLVWVPVSKCAVDPNRHGWRQVFLVLPPHVRGEPLVAFGVFSSREEAEGFVASSGRVDLSISATPLGNLHLYQGPDGSQLLVPAPPVTSSPVFPA